MHNPSIFDEQITRIQRVTQTRTQEEVAAFLGIPQSHLTDAKRRKRLPADWLIILLRLRGVHPEWILTGRGPQCLQSQSHIYDDENTARRKREEAEALQKISSQTLAEELIRRIVVAEADTFSRTMHEEFNFSVELSLTTEKKF